jgi:hypothetical protein
LKMAPTKVRVKENDPATSRAVTLVGAPPARSHGLEP